MVFTCSFRKHWKPPNLFPLLWPHTGSSNTPIMMMANKKRKQDFQLNSKLDSNSEVDENKGQKEILR